MREPPGEIGAVIRQCREARGISLRALAREVGISPASLSNVERGRTPLTVDRLEQVAAALGTTVSQLLVGEGGARESRGADGAGEDWRRFDALRLGVVLEASVRLIVRQGYHATSMREIAAGAGLSVSGVYHHYASKEAILVALLDLTLGEIEWRLAAAQRQGEDATDSFARMVEALALFHAVRGDLAFVGATEMRALSPQERRRITASRDKIQHALDAQGRKALGVRPGDDEDLRVATRAISTMCTSLPSWFRPGEPLSAEEMALRYARFAVALLRTPGPSPGPLAGPVPPAPDSVTALP